MMAGDGRDGVGANDERGAPFITQWVAGRWQHVRQSGKTGLCGWLLRLVSPVCNYNETVDSSSFRIQTAAAEDISASFRHLQTCGL